MANLDVSTMQDDIIAQVVRVPSSSHGVAISFTLLPLTYRFGDPSFFRLPVIRESSGMQLFVFRDDAAAAH